MRFLNHDVLAILLSITSIGDRYQFLSRYALSRQGHKDAPMRFLNPDEIADLVPIMRMDDVSDWPVRISGLYLVCIPTESEIWPANYRTIKFFS